MDRMSPQDASFLHIENADNQMHIGSVTIFEGPAPTYDEIVELIGARLRHAPRYRQKVRFVPLSLARPVWVDDPHFNVGYHVRHTALPAPGGEAELQRMAGRVMSQQLDRTRPLWEIWLVEGLSEGRWALLSKVHHCMVDGVASTDLLSVLFDDERAGESPAGDVWSPAREPSALELVASSVALRAFDPREPLRDLTARALAPRDTARRLVELARGGSAMARAVRPARGSSLSGQVGPHRRWSWARARLSDVTTVRAAFGGTVNDVVLSVVANGFRELLQSRGESVEGRTVRTMVPVSVRRPHDRGVYDNRVSAVFADLPVGVGDPVERLHAVRAQMDGLKESKQAVAGEVLVSLSGFAPPMLLALGARIAVRAPQLNVETATTNVPGPQRPVYTLGRRLLETFPYAPVLGPIRIVVSIFSYDGALGFGVVGDLDGAPDIDVLSAGIERGLAELVAAAGGSEPVPAPEAPKAVRA
jgi:diacylglycerol O-acyltransferase